MTIICFSHLRWNFVYQRPQHLLSRFANKYNILYVEEFINSAENDGYTVKDSSSEKLKIIVPKLKFDNTQNLSINARIENIIKNLLGDFNIENYIFWYYTPMALNFTQTFMPILTIYDCMDELSHFKFAPPELIELEQQLFLKADLVFTGGDALYQAKKHRHLNIFSFPSSIDKNHFGKSRNSLSDPIDQQNIPNPRLGFFGVIDERFDIDLIKNAADLKPDWHFILIGPVIKIDQSTLPRNKNIHYLHSKSYDELPLYLSNWDIALIPFAINDSTKFISPTKTPEYLAGGKPVISTAITDVIKPYGEQKLVHVVRNANELVEKACEELSNNNKAGWLKKVDDYLKDISWDHTKESMNELIRIELEKKQHLLTASKTEKHVRLLDSRSRSSRLSIGGEIS